MNLIELGEKIKKIRKKREQTQAEFAKELHIDLSYLGKLERGERVASLDILEKIAKKGNISVGTLLTFEENELFQVWESETKDLALEEKEVLAEVFKQQIIALKPILKKNK